MDQLRADTFLDLLEGVGLGASPVHRKGVVDLTVPWATVVGAGDEPGDLAGYGPIDAATIRELLATLAAGGKPSGGDVDWYCSVIGDDGALLAHHRIRPDGRTTGHNSPPVEANPDRRHPGPSLARWVIARDRTCRAPGCTVPARACDIDHTTDHAHGGATSHNNLGLLCRHHHRLKHEGGWKLTQPSPGHFEWQSPTGRIYRT